MGACRSPPGASAYALFITLLPRPLTPPHRTVDGGSAFPSTASAALGPGQGPDPGLHFEWTAAPGPPGGGGAVFPEFDPISWEALASV